MTLPSIRFRPRAHQRGEDTRRRILETAIEIFAVEGYEGATTRMLAEQAEVNLPAIQYYFGSKEGLYRAAVAHIVERIEERMAPAAERVVAALESGQPSWDQLLALLFDMLDAFAELVIGGSDPDSWSQFLARAEVEDGAALDPLHEGFMRQVIRPCAVLVGRLLDRSPDDERVLLRTLTILGQIGVFHKKCSHGAKRVLGIVDFTEDRVKTIQALAREQTEIILRAARDGKIS